MRTIQPVNAYRRDYRRVKSNPKHRKLDDLLTPLLKLLANDQPLPTANRDHALTGHWVDHRACHVRPDLLLIYRKPDPETLQLVRLGPPSELFR